VFRWTATWLQSGAIHLALLARSLPSLSASMMQLAGGNSFWLPNLSGLAANPGAVEEGSELRCGVFQGRQVFTRG
jgi:hypothetical protein